MNTRNNYQRFLFPLLKQIDPESAHDRTIFALSRAQHNAVGRSILQRIAGSLPRDPVDLFGLRFPNVLGVAAGFDKNVQAVEGLALLGFGHIEVGTITPRPQSGNEKPRVFRLPEDTAIINRMGFPSCGMAVAGKRLKALKRSGNEFLVGVSLGMQKETLLAQAVHDYIEVLQAVFPYADYLAVNISSPNTPELRRLQGERYLGDLLAALVEENQSQAEKSQSEPRPLLVKIAPDLTPHDLEIILQVTQDNKIDGIVATNTTVSRNGLQNRHKDQTGGLSGKPLSTLSLQIISHLARETAGRLPIVAVGGIFTADDVQARLDAGASLVQIYSALIYEGPGLAGTILRDLASAGDLDKV